MLIVVFIAGSTNKAVLSHERSPASLGESTMSLNDKKYCFASKPTVRKTNKFYMTVAHNYHPMLMLPTVVKTFKQIIYALPNSSTS